MTDDKRLIEDYLPIEAISAEASREKSVHKAHISTLHLWWARRPLVACRAVVYGALVPVSRFAWFQVSKKSTPANQEDLGRKEAEKFVERLCKYPGDKAVIAEAEQHILEAHAHRLAKETGNTVTVEDIQKGRAPRPRVLDMFAGGGAIPLEALRLGCEALALDLNPVAHLIELCTLVYPQKYSKPEHGYPGVAGAKNARGETTWGGLAKEVRYWGNWILERVRSEISDLYPFLPDPEAKAIELVPEKEQRLFSDEKNQQRLKAAEKYLIPLAYFWTRTVRCKNPDCGAIVPMVKQTWLSKKKNHYVAMRMEAKKGNKEVTFEIVEAEEADALGFDPGAFSKGGNAACPFCGTVADSDYVKTEGCAGRVGDRLMAVACSRSGKRGKVYLSSDELSDAEPENDSIRMRINQLCSRTGLTIPDEPIITDAKNSSWTYLYGLTKFNQLFNPRQLLCLLTFAASVRDAQAKMREMNYDEGHLKAIATYCGLLQSRLADWNSTICHWIPVGEKVADTFARQAIPWSGDYSEIQPLARVSGGSFEALNRMIEAIEALDLGTPATVERGSATRLPWPNQSVDAVITDPPYYDNVPYANLSDFFFVWLKRSIGNLYPEHFATEGAPKRNEAVADAVRHGRDRAKAKQAYEKTMSDSFVEANRVLKADGQLAVVYAHKTTLGWSTLVDALRVSGFTVTEAWPLDTEKPGRLREQESAALATSIFLVARKRQGPKTGSYEVEVRPDLERIVRERVETLWKMGISGADLVIAAVGAGLRAFTRFARVEFANGEEVPAERFLVEVEGVVLETLLEKIFGYSRSGVAAVDAPSRFYVLWRYAYKSAELDSGEAIVFAYPQSVELDGTKGLTQGRSALVEKKKNKYRLRDYSERGAREELGIRDEDNPNGSVPLIDILHRVLWLMENEPRKLNAYLGHAVPDRERLRQVAQALAGPGLKGAEGDGKLINTTSAEAAALGKLLANWRILIDARLEEFRLRS